MDGGRSTEAICRLVWPTHEMMNVLYAFNIGDKMSFILVSGPGMGRKMGLPVIRFNLKGQARKWVSGFSLL